MTTKDLKQNTKTKLMDDLKSIKGILNADDDNVPLLLDDDDNVPILEDDDVPTLVDDDGDIPVLSSSSETASNKASLEAAIRQLESMELAPKAKPHANKLGGIEDKIRANAAPPLIKDDEQTRIRENPFLNKNSNDRFAESRKQAEDALKSVIAHSKSLSTPAKPIAEETKTSITAVKENPSEGAIEFTDNQFLKASSAQAAPILSPAPKKQAPTTPESTKEDAADDILKLLGEEAEVELDLDEGFGDLVDIDVDALIAEKSPPAKATAKVAATKNAPAASSLKNKSQDKELDQIVDEVIDEYMIILEAALRKKLKEKLPDLLKK